MVARSGEGEGDDHRDEMGMQMQMQMQDDEDEDRLCWQPDSFGYTSKSSPGNWPTRGCVLEGFKGYLPPL